MSSYLGIYGKLRNSNKYIRLCTINRNNPIYVTFSDNLQMPYKYVGDSDEPIYKKLELSDLEMIINDVKEYILKYSTRLNELEKHAGGNIDIIDEIISFKTDIVEFHQTLGSLRLLAIMMDDIKYGDEDNLDSYFENYYYNVD